MSLFLFFRQFGFGIMLLCYLLLVTFVCAYQIIIIAGKIGLAQLGRFATFALLPALCLFRINALQITLISTFVEVAIGVAVDALFGRKLMLLQQVDACVGKRLQYVGLIISALAAGIVFWFFITHLGLGTPELFAQRAQARALLVQVQQFNIWLLIIGALFGFVLKYVRLSPMLVLGGLLMPTNIMLGLLLGGLMTLVTDDAQRWFPFWSGVFAANSVWMLLRIFL